MTGDYFDRLTRLDGWEAAAGSANDDEARELAADLAPALALLGQGVPPNGIDLVPRWEKFLADPALVASVTPVSSLPARAKRASRWYALMGYAGTLVAGMVIGAWVRQESPAAPVVPATSTEVCRYTDDQRRQMFALLETPATVPPAKQLASAGLMGCVGCHASLRTHWAVSQPGK